MPKVNPQDFEEDAVGPEFEEDVIEDELHWPGSYGVEEAAFDEMAKSNKPLKTGLFDGLIAREKRGS